MNKRHSPAWYDAQYNNRGRIPEHPQILQSWAERSSLALSEPGCIHDVPYMDLVEGKHLAPAEAGHTLDVFLPSAAGHGAASDVSPQAGAPVLVYLHGGYWRALSKRDQAFIAPPFAAAGALVVVPDYPLAPKVTVEQIVLQVAQAVAWTWRNAHRYGGNPDRLIVAGHSAGGHLAAMMLALQWPVWSPDLPADLVKGAVSLSGVFELEPLRHAPFLAADLGLDEGRAQRLSPAEMPAPRVPLIALVGAEESEEFLRQNRLIRRRWGAKTVPICETVPGRHHMNVLHDLADPDARAHQLTLGLLGLRKTN